MNIRRQIDVTAISILMDDSAFKLAPIQTHDQIDDHSPPSQQVDWILIQLLDENKCEIGRQMALHVCCLLCELLT